MHTPTWASDRPTASRCSAFGCVTPPHRVTAGGPPEDEDVAVTDRDELWEHLEHLGGSVSVYIL